MLSIEDTYFLKKQHLHWQTKYHEQGIRAAKRGIVFNMTFKEWLRIWMDSGQLNNRGTKMGQYVMARKKDKGPYAVGNIAIITSQQNIKDIKRGPVSEKTKEKMRAAHKARHENRKILDR